MSPTICPECGAALRPDAVFCIACGRGVRPLEWPTPPPGPAAPPRSPGQADPTQMHQSPPNWAAPPPPSPYPRQPFATVKTYFVESIIVTILCCLPLGIVAIIFAVQAEMHSKGGNLPAALEASNKAKVFTILSVILGIVGAILSFAFGFSVGLGGLEW